MTRSIDFDAIRHEHSLVDHVAAVVKLRQAGCEWEAPCPFHADRTPSFRIYGSGLRWICHAGCGGGDLLDFIRKLHGVNTSQAIQMVSLGNLPSVHVAAAPPETQRVDRLEEARSIWRQSSAARGTEVETYLRARGITVPVPDSIRFARLRYGRKGPLHPVLVAVVADANSRLIGIQRTYLNAAGTGKLAVDKPKLSLGHVSGGAIRLAPAARILFVTEGLEDGLTLQQEQGRATWVSAGAGNLHKMIFPAGVEDVAIGGDADERGYAEARKAVAVFKHRGIVSRAFFPADAKDFNAELMGRLAA